MARLIALTRLDEKHFSMPYSSSEKLTMESWRLMAYFTHIAPLWSVGQEFCFYIFPGKAREICFRLDFAGFAGVRHGFFSNGNAFSPVMFVVFIIQGEWK